MSHYRVAPGGSRAAFTLVELLVVIAIIAILASIVLAAIGRAKGKAQGIICLNNVKQLTLAWTMYVNDNKDQLPFTTYPRFDPAHSYGVWTTGFLDYNPNNASNWDVEQDIKRSLIWPYCGNAASIFKCPGDHSVIKPATGPYKGQTVPRVRSMSLNLWVGEAYFDADRPAQEAGGYVIYHRLNDLVDPGPAGTFLFLDEREDSISGPDFLLIMDLYPDPATTYMLSFPSSYHNGAAEISFADGHAETKRWLDLRTTPRLTRGSNALYQILQGSQPNNRDITWLRDHCTRHYTP